MTQVVASRRVRRLSLFVGAMFALLPAGSALAVPTATTIGQTGGGFSCGTAGGGSVIADTKYVVPAGGGTITSFSFQSGATNAGQQLDFLVLRPVSGITYKVVGETGLQTLAGSGLETFSASISVQAGDILGFWTAGSGVLFDNCLRTVASGGGSIGVGNVTDPALNTNHDIPPFSSTSDVNESATFTPAVQGVPEQLQSLLGYMTGLGSSVPKINLLKLMYLTNNAIAYPTDKSWVCPNVSNVALGAQWEQAAGMLTPKQAAAIIAAANNIVAAAGCNPTP